MNKLVITPRQFNKLVQKICRDITLDGWRPDYVVGLTRGGLTPAVMISHYFDVPMKSLDVSLRDGGDTVTNCGMAEDALGYPLPELEVGNDLASVLEGASELLEMGVGKDWRNILIVDDINDTGATFNWIMKDWQDVNKPNDPGWDHVWNENVRFAVIVDNLSSKSEVIVDYVGKHINKAENDVWVEFPWEDWWSK